MGRYVLSAAVTGILGFLLEYGGTEVTKDFYNTNHSTIYIATLIWALIVGPLIAAFRRASILVPMGIVGGLFFVIVLLNHYSVIAWEIGEGGFRDSGQRVGQRVWEWTNGELFGLRHPLLIALVAGLFQTIVVPASVLLQKLITLPIIPRQRVDLDEVEGFFGDSIIPTDVMKPKRGFGFILMLFIAIAYGAYFAYQIVGLTVDGRDLPIVQMAFLNPPEAINTFGKLTLMLSLALVGAYNAGVRREAAVLLLIGHMISVVGSIWLYFAYPVNPLFAQEKDFLVSTIVADGLLAIALVVPILKRREEQGSLASAEDVELRSPASTLTRYFYLVFGILFSFYFASIVYFRALGDPEASFGAVFGGPDPLVTNSLAKYGTIASLCLLLFARPRMRRFFVPTLSLAFFVTVVATVVYGFQGDTEIVTRLGTTVQLPWFMMLHVVVDGGGLLMILGTRRMQYHVDFHVTGLSPGPAECVMSLHRALREAHQEPERSARTVLQRIDEQIVGMRGRRRGLLTFPFWMMESVLPRMAGLRPPFSTMSRVEQRWMLRRFVLRPPWERSKSLIPAAAELSYQVGEITHGLITLAFFSSPAGQRVSGYVPPEARQRLLGDHALSRPPRGADPRPLPSEPGDPHGLRPQPSPQDPPLLVRCLATNHEDSAPPTEVDYCVIGSGAAGGVLAHRLARARGGDDSVLVVERGGYFDPARDFNDDEMSMFRMLYAEGGLQTTRSFDFSVLQGECVGGTTVINNAVCFEMPEVSRTEWAQFGIDTSTFDPHYRTVSQEIQVAPVGDLAANELVERKFAAGVEAYNRDLASAERLTQVTRISGNFSNCLGCGLCNLGCRRVRKLSVLETYIPWARANGAEIVSNAGAVSVEFESGGATRRRVRSLLIRLSDGQYQRIRIRKALVVAAGAVASSRLLMRSQIGGPGVGRGLSCNYAIPPMVEFDEPLDAFDGLQMALFAAPESHEAIFETTFNPPGTFAISTPLYFGQHGELMRSYRNAANFTALVGSDPSGSVSRKRDLLHGRAIEWQPTQRDLEAIQSALSSIVRIAAGAGAKRVVLPTLPPKSIRLDSDPTDELRKMAAVLLDRRYLNLVTAHPQGGNLMAGVHVQERVVDPDFRVRDCDNLYACDASVFPRGIRVNPQLTIMALASLAAESILEQS